MPNPTTNPKPSPKPPPVCKKGTSPIVGPPVPIGARLLHALVVAFTVETGLARSINQSLPLYPEGPPFDWAGNIDAGGFTVEVWALKNDLDDLYTLGLSFSIGPIPFYRHEWPNQRPRTFDPLTFAEVAWNDPLTNNQATLTIIT